MTNQNEGKYLIKLSSQSPTQSTAPPRASTSTTIISAEFSSKKGWDNKLKLIHSVMSSRGTSSKSPVVMTETDLP